MGYSVQKTINKTYKNIGMFLIYKEYIKNNGVTKST